MSINRVSLYHLETLLWIDRLGTFSAAAERLNTTQPAVSARMRELEQRLGSPLFRRDDLIEIFIDPVGQGRNYLELGASAAGFYYSLRIPQAVDGRVQPQPLPLQDIALATHFNGTLNDASDRDISWSIEVKIPLADIALASGAPLSFTTAWRLGLFRIDYDHNTPEWKALGFYSWQNHGRFSFHRPERFGFLQFAPTGPLKKS